MTDPLLREVRKDFGLLLREVRVAARLSGQQMVSRLGWYASKVSKIEHGDLAVSDDDLTSWLAATGASPATADRVRAEWSALDVRYQEARDQWRVFPMVSLRRMLEASHQVVSIRWYETARIPGTLQTRAYARHVMEGGTSLVAGFSLEEAVDLRARRAMILASRTFGRFQYVLLETVLHNRMCPSDVWVDQMNHLIRLSAAGPAQIGILPCSSPMAPTFASEPFTIWDDRVVEIDTVVGMLQRTGAHDVGWAVRAFGLLWEDSVKGGDARALLVRSRDAAGAMRAQHRLTGRVAGVRPSLRPEPHPAQPAPTRE